MYAVYCQIVFMDIEIYLEIKMYKNAVCNFYYAETK